MQARSGLGFVSTAVLESDNSGLSYDKETRLEAKEVGVGGGEAARLPRDLEKLNARQGSLTLYEQLAQNKEAAEEEARAKKALAFAPPKALDDEDVEFLQEREDLAAEAEARIRQQEDADTEAFVAAIASKKFKRPDALDAMRASSAGAAAAGGSSGAGAGAAAATGAKLTLGVPLRPKATAASQKARVKARFRVRKAGGEAGEDKSAGAVAKRKADEADEAPTAAKKRPPAEPAAEAKAQPPVKSQGLAMLGGYASSSDDD